MTTKYTIPTVESILEDSEDESREELRTSGDSADEKYRKSRPMHDTVMKANVGRERERDRERDRPRRHRSSKHTSKGKSKNGTSRRASGITREEYEESRLRHRHGHSNRSSSSASSSDEEEQEDHRAILAARSRLTSPSMVSTFTTQTTATNKSSSSSGSNSTVTQASITKRSSLGKKPEVEEAGEPPMSPAVPDPPSVFQFLDNNGPPEPEHQEEEDDHEVEGHEVEEEKGEESEESDEDRTPHWSPKRIQSAYDEPPSKRLNHNASVSSSASSSFHGDDNASEPAVDVDTDRSSSPERSVDGHDGVPEPHPTDQASAKIASQMAAAQERQNVHVSMQQFGTPDMPRGNTQLPHIPSSALSSRYQYHMQQRPLPRAEKLPVTGYELLASRLSAFPGSDNENGGRIKPMYRKFEALNHRLLLHLQDELSELEEQLHRLDHADTQSRRLDHHGYIIPASRRLAAQAGGELQWHKTDVLGKIGYKLNQYSTSTPHLPAEHS
ncbi:hypothetical protein ONS96_003834 [Cadophora gregata f. sp. sojae]|nr:hypothetical protein ONS96_003834 [Cadophora gregata f. sp. sojae]